jgi:uncharacterized protein YndB with AHSA1/START domain
MSDADLVLHVRIAASPRTVFGFLSDPNKFQKWMGDRSAISPVRGGGISVAYPNGDTAVGEIEEVVPNQKIVFTWGYENSAHGLMPGATRVTITLQEIPEGTLVALRHEGLPSQESRRNHLIGWRYYLALLSSTSSDEHFASILPAVMKAYLGAWNESNPEQREKYLAECWSDSGVYRDCFTHVEGRSPLDETIGMARMMQADSYLAFRGSPHLSHGHVFFAWEVKHSSGSVMATGTSFGQLSIKGQFLSVVGFWDPPNA